jgi:hypothetical protein
MNTSYAQRINNFVFEKVFSYCLNYWIEKYFTPNSYIYFKNVHDIYMWGKQYDSYYESIKKQYDDSWLSDRKFYPSEVLQYYAGYYNLKVNAFLRGTERWELVFIEDIVREHVNTLNKEICKNVLKESVVTVRRIPSYVFEKSERECCFKNSLIDKAFLSTSLNLFYRKDNEGRIKSLNNETLLVIMVKKGTRALYLEQISNREEYELLLPSGVRINILNKIRVLNNRIV